MMVWRRSFLLQVAGHPRNNLMADSTFLTVERLGDDEVWIPVATDADWETKYACQIVLQRNNLFIYLTMIT